MKYIKTYENSNLPEVGDYVCLKPTKSLIRLADNNMDVVDFLTTHVAKVFRVLYADYGIEYEENVANDDNMVFVSRGDVQYFSKNKHDVEMFMTQNKYNL